MNILYFGDCLEILRDKISDNFVDLIYLDPPFKSGKNYNIIFRPEKNNIKGATAQIRTFADTWGWGSGEAEKEYRGLINNTITKEKPNQKLIDLMKSMRTYLDECSMMAYLCMMAPRLLEIRRVLKNTGSIYLHCDPTASHYLKLFMDAIFNVKNFQNEFIWYKGGGGGASKKRWARKHDVILFYTKTANGNHTFNIDDVRMPYKWTNGQLRADGSHRNYEKGKIPDDVWEHHDILPWSSEDVGYPTQKPEVLLERIIKASSNEGDLVLDPFCGCGTAIAIAERLKRRWIGIDVTYLAIDVIEKRLEKDRIKLEKDGIKEGISFKIEGAPADLYSAEKLAQKNPFQFQIWCITRLKGGTPSQTKSDKGVDGIINFFDPAKKSEAGKGIVSVKGTQTVNPSMVRELKGTMKSQGADFGILVTLKKPTKGMKTEAIKEGYFEYAQRRIPKIQLLTVEDLLKKPMPVELPGFIFEPYKKPLIKKYRMGRLDRRHNP